MSLFYEIYCFSCSILLMQIKYSANNILWWFSICLLFLSICREKSFFCVILRMRKNWVEFRLVRGALKILQIGGDWEGFMVKNHFFRKFSSICFTFLKKKQLISLKIVTNTLYTTNNHSEFSPSIHTFSLLFTVHFILHAL